MGSTHKLFSVTPGNINKLMFPIIFCIDKTKISKYIKGYTFLSLNEILAKRLLPYAQDKRKLFVIDELNRIVHSIEGPLLIEDFEILFDPDYQIDVLKTFILLNREKKIAVLWPGKFEKGKLKFAKPEYKDYKSYNINDYDMTCIV